MTGMTEFWITEAKYRNTVKWKHRKTTWPELLDSLRETFRSTETMYEFGRMSKDERDRLKEMPGCFCAARLKDGLRNWDNVMFRTLVTLDADAAHSRGDGADAWKADWNTFTCLHDDLACACYPTHSSTPKRPRLRWLFPVSRPMTPEEYPAVERRVAEWIGPDTMDSSTFDLNRFFYYPGVPKDAPYELLEQEGEPIDVDEVLKSYGSNEAWKDTSLWPTVPGEDAPRLRNGEPAPDPREKPGPVGLFCRTYSIEDVLDNFLTEQYSPSADGRRYTYVKGTTSNGGVVLDNGLWFRSFHGTDPAGCAMNGDHNVNAFDLVRIHLFGSRDAETEPDTPVTKLPSYAAMTEWMDALPEVQERKKEEDAEELERTLGDLLTRGTDREVPEDVDPDWKKKLTRNKKTKLPEATLNNVILFLENLPEFHGKLFKNPMDDTYLVDGDLPWWSLRVGGNDVYSLFGEEEAAKLRSGLNGDKKKWREGDRVEYYTYFEPLGFPTTGQNNGVLDNGLRAVTGRHEYHPIRNYLIDLKWDGVERLDTVFIRWLGAEDNELNRVITRRWMMAAVDRVMRPGCQFDQILITVGPQGIGKSKLLRYLAKGYFTSSIKALEVGKATSEMLQGVWIAEIGELDGVKRGEQNAIKNFITTTSDRYRGAYRRDAEDHPRQCVLAGTSNEGSFLRDETGERRYWIMRVKGTGDRGELNGFKDEVDQIWAEAVEAWRTRVREMWQPGMDLKSMDLYLYLREDDLEDAMTARREQYKLPSEDKLDLVEFLDRPRPDNWEDMTAQDRRRFIQNDGVFDMGSCNYRRDRVCIKEIVYELYGGDGRDAGNKSYRLASLLDNLPGWRKADKQTSVKGYGRSSRPLWIRIGGKYDKAD